MIKKLNAKLETPWTAKTYFKWCAYLGLIFIGAGLFFKRCRKRIHRMKSTLSYNNGDSRFDEVQKEDLRLS